MIVVSPFVINTLLQRGVGGGWTGPNRFSGFRQRGGGIISDSSACLTVITTERGVFALGKLDPASYTFTFNSRENSIISVSLMSNQQIT